MRTLVLVAHPDLSTSRVNRRLLKELRSRAGSDQVTIHDLYAAYPDWQIDVEAEQALVLQHDRIVFQFPLFWYSSPALLREWQDLIFEFGWAYGDQGTQMHGKQLMVVTTAGSLAENYVEGGPVGFTAEQLLAPFKATSSFIGADYLEPFVLLGVLEDYSDQQLEADAKRYADHVLG